MKSASPLMSYGSDVIESRDEAGWAQRDRLTSCSTGSFMAPILICHQARNESRSMWLALRTIHDPTSAAAHLETELAVGLAVAGPATSGGGSGLSCENYLEAYSINKTLQVIYRQCVCVCVIRTGLTIKHTEHVLRTLRGKGYNDFIFLKLFSQSYVLRSSLINFLINALFFITFLSAIIFAYCYPAPKLRNTYERYDWRHLLPIVVWD